MATCTFHPCAKAAERQVAHSIYTACRHERARFAERLECAVRRHRIALDAPLSIAPDKHGNLVVRIGDRDLLTWQQAEA